MPLFAKYLIFSQHRPHCPSFLLQAFTDPWLAITLSHTTVVLIMGNFNKTMIQCVLSLPFPILQWTCFLSPYLIIPMCVCSVAQLCLTFCSTMDCRPPGSSVHGIFQERILEWVAISNSMGSSPPSTTWETQSFPWPYPKTLFFPITTTLSQSYSLTVTS